MDHQEDYTATARKVRSGEYFREARAWYAAMVFYPMWERYFYLFVTCIALLILGVSIRAAAGLFPLQVQVPFIVKTENIHEELPRITSLARQGESHNASLEKFLVLYYVNLREEYDIDQLARQASAIRQMSADDVFEEYKRLMDLKNPASPVLLYQRTAVRRVRMLAYQKLPGQEGFNAEVLFEATVEDSKVSKKTRWIANIAFRFNEIILDQDTLKTTPFEFVVTRYQTERLQDS